MTSANKHSCLNTHLNVKQITFGIAILTQCRGKEERKKMKEEVVKQVRENILCTDFLERAKKGNYICPFCKSGTGSNHTGALYFYRKTNTFTCFACRKSGDCIDLMQEKYGYSFSEALRVGAEMLGIENKNEKITNDKEYKINKKSAEIGDFGPINSKPTADYTNYYKRCIEKLENSDDAISYLTARGISLETALAYGLGYDEESDPANAPGAEKGQPKPHPAKRLIISTTPEHYVGVAIDRANVEKGFWKLNANNSTPGVFGAEEIYSEGPIFITEGVFDALSFIEVGYKAIALNSTSNGNLLLQQIQEKQITQKFIICFDVDQSEATRNRTQQAAEELKNNLDALRCKTIVYNIAGYLLNGEKDINDIIQRDKNLVKKMAEEAIKEINKDSITAFLEKIQTEAYKPYETGLAFFDDLLGGGIIRQTLMILTAAPGAGKTTLCQQLAEEIALSKKPVIYLNLEMSEEQMIAKAISRRLASVGKKYSATDVLQGYKWTEEQRADIESAIDSYKWKIGPYLRYNPAGVGTNIDKIKEYLQSVGEKARTTGTEAPIVVLDYLHLVSSKKNVDEKNLIKDSIFMLKDYAKRYNTLVIAISAVSREKMDKGPLGLCSGRDSSNIEYTADYILTLNYWAVDQYQADPQKDDEIAELQKGEWRQMILRLPKNRFGQPGHYKQVYFNPAQNKFFDNYKKGVGAYIPNGAKAFDSYNVTPKKRK